MMFDLPSLMLPAPQSDRPLFVAVTGHCALGDDVTIAFVTQAFTALLLEIKATQPAGVVALSGLAPGADTIFAEVALTLAIPLEACIAATNVIEKYAPGPEREQHFRLRQASQHVHTLPFTERCGQAYLALGYWLVHSCDLLIAAWHGRPAAKPGGTGDVVAYARTQGRPVIHIHTGRRTIAPLARDTDCHQP
jgi:hypothetical protein